MPPASGFDWTSWLSTLGELSEKLTLGSFGAGDVSYAHTARVQTLALLRQIVDITGATAGSVTNITGSGYVGTSPTETGAGG